MTAGPSAERAFNPAPQWGSPHKSSGDVEQLEEHGSAEGEGSGNGTLSMNDKGKAKAASVEDYLDEGR